MSMQTVGAIPRLWKVNNENPTSEQNEEPTKQKQELKQ
jgi:hypothetical protein